MPPFADTENCGTAVVFALRPIWVAHDHSEDPEGCRCPSTQKDSYAEKGRECQHKQRHANGVVSICLARRGWLFGVDLGVNPLRGG